MPDCAYIVFKDNKTGQKHLYAMKEPTYTYYIAKPEIQIPYNLEWIEIEKTKPVTCKYKDIKKSIAIETGNYDLYKANVSSGNYKLNDTFGLELPDDGILSLDDCPSGQELFVASVQSFSKKSNLYIH